MSRELRKRSSRPNYASLAGLNAEPEPVAGPSTSKQRKTRHIPARERSSSALDHDPDADAEAEIDEDFIEEQDPEPEAGIVDSDTEKNRSASAKKPKKSSQRKPRKSATVALTAISAQASNGGLSLPNLHHRHRALPLFHRDAPVERLVSQPRLFQTPDVQSTNSGISSNFAVGGRVNKSWSCNVGPGPLWELIEDRGWYKESLLDPGEIESSRRPRVHFDVKVPDICETLHPEVGSVYLPSHNGSGPSKPIICAFGPVSEQQKLQVGTFSSIPMHSYFPGSKSHVFNAGAPVWGLDWCPIHPDERAALRIFTGPKY